jgi:hypothetical protein
MNTILLGAPAAIVALKASGLPTRPVLVAVTV